MPRSHASRVTASSPAHRGRRAFRNRAPVGISNNTNQIKPANARFSFTKYLVLLILSLATPVAHEILPKESRFENTQTSVLENKSATPTNLPTPSNIRETALQPDEKTARANPLSSSFQVSQIRIRERTRMQGSQQKLRPADLHTVPGIRQPEPLPHAPPELHWGKFALAQTLTVGIGGYGFYYYNSLYGRVGQPFKIGNDWNKDHSLHFDELLHFQGGYRITQAVSAIYRWAGVPAKTSDWIGLGTSALIMTSLEYVDGRRINDEASYSDLAANFLGMGFALARNRVSWLQDFDLRLSYRTLADPFRRSTVKRYDRITHWLTYDLNRQWKLPLNVGLGYGVVNARKSSAQAQYFLGIGISPSALMEKFSPGAAKTLAWLDFYHFGNQVALNNVAVTAKNGKRKS